MSNPTHSNDQAPNQTQAAPEVRELTFSEYEAARREGKTIDSIVIQSAPAQKAEQKPASESDPEESEEAKAQDETEETKDSSSEDEDSEESKEDKTPKKKGGFQRRIDKLNARIAAREQELEDLRRAMADKARPEGAKEKVDQKQADGKPRQEDFESFADYTEALTDWKTDQKLKARDAEAQKKQLETQQRKLVETYSERAKAFAEKVEDFEDVLSEVEDVTLPAALQELIISSENGPQLAYELAKNRKELERITKLSPLALAREVGRIENRIEARASTPEKKPEAKKLTKAPKPIDPVGGTKSTLAKSIDDPDLSFAEYERLRREQIKRRGA